MVWLLNVVFWLKMWWSEWICFNWFVIFLICLVTCFICWQWYVCWTGLSTFLIRLEVLVQKFFPWYRACCIDHIGTALLLKVCIGVRYLENFCSTLKTALLWKTALIWKFALLLKNGKFWNWRLGCVTIEELRYFEKLKILKLKVGVRYYWKLR